MAKIKISKKHKTSSKKNYIKINKQLFEEYKPFKNTLNKKVILQAIAECVQAGDFDGVLEIITIYIRALKRAKHYDSEKSKSTIKAKSATNAYGSLRPQMARNNSDSIRKKIV